MNQLKPAMPRQLTARVRQGFTLVELVIVMIIGGILLTYAIPGFTRMAASRNAQNARDALVWLGNRARSRAMAVGNVQLLEIDPTRNAAWVVRRNGATAADTTAIIYFDDEHKSTVTTSTGNPITVCYSPRGYAFACSANSPTTNVQATLTHIEKTAVARVKPLGQIERL